MSKKIFKYELQIKDLNKVIMKKGAEVLSIQTQNEIACIWALVDPYEIDENRFFEIFGTGNIVPQNSFRKFIGTFQLSGGLLVYHCFELLKP